MNRRWLHGVGTVLLVLVVVPFVIFAVPQTVGADHGYVVVSASMSPAISAGDVVIVEETHPETITTGDVITFRQDSTTGPERTTHRVVAVIERADGRYFRTKGDANEDPDPSLVPAEDVTGEVAFSIPWIGWVITVAGTDTGIVAFVVIPATALAVSELWTLLRATSLVDADTPPESDTDE